VPAAEFGIGLETAGSEHDRVGGELDRPVDAGGTHTDDAAAVREEVRRTGGVADLDPEPGGDRGVLGDQADAAVDVADVQSAAS
jgi:hypothetical protein